MNIYTLISQGFITTKFHENLFCIISLRSGEATSQVASTYKEIRSCGTSWWRHQMETSSALLALYFRRGIHRPSMESPHKGHWCWALMFSWISIWTKARVNDRDACDLRCHNAHYDVTVMWMISWLWAQASHWTTSRLTSPIILVLSVSGTLL